MSPVVAEIEALFARHGGETYGEGVTQLQHALQTAALAAAEGADDALVVAALLHDVGHFLQPTDDSYGYHKHDRSGGAWLAQRFGPAVSEPVRLHVAAKRCLCATEADYFGKLSAASVHSLSKQGGPMSAAEVAAFSASPHAAAAMRLRRWDDGGKLEGIVVPDLPDYREQIAHLLKA
jgi:[1-hydroxy-2-(trimethylamino)ethyl]phosphonate dioxygenase